MEFVLAAVLILGLLGAFVFRSMARAQHARTGVPLEARVVYADTGAWRRVEKPLYSARYRLVGKPDYIVQDEAGAPIPIEVKPSRRAAQPYEVDIMQLMAYGLLVEEEYGTRPAFGLLKYREAVFRVEFTDELRGRLFELMEEMRQARQAYNVPRSHADARRCQACGYRQACNERIEQ